MLSTARCAWLDFVEAHRLQAALVPFVGFLMLILFLLFQEKIGRLPRRILQVAIMIFVFAGLAAVIYELQSPQECAASSLRAPECPECLHASAPIYQYAMTIKATARGTEALLHHLRVRSFNRTFRRRYGAAPREIRQSAMRDGPPA
jgi:hypothetical protein